MTITSLMRIILTRSLQPFKFTNDYSNALDFKDLANLGLYVHIPFCRQICSFCPYCKVPYKKDVAVSYKAALLKEIDLVGSQSAVKKRVTSLYFGGGTPSLMLHDLGDIIEALKKYFTITEGIGVELHPSDINETTLQTLKEAGVTMVSIGIQSFDEGCLLSIGRNNDDFIHKLELVKSYNFEAVDVDLIFGLPNQSEEILIKDVETAFKHGATQVSTYPFIDFTFANNTHKPLSERHKKRMLTTLVHYAEANDIERTSVWTFAKRNTMKYSSVTRDSFLGFGVSATTLLANQFKINTFDIQSYMNRVNNQQLPTALTLNFSKYQRACYYLFWSAYSLQINEENYLGIIKKPLKNMYGLEMLVARVLGLVKKTKTGYTLTTKGAYYYHYFEQAYTTAYIDKMWNNCRVEPFPKEIVLK